MKERDDNPGTPATGGASNGRSTGSVYDAAREYRDLGLSVIPIRSGTKKPACKAWTPYQQRLASESNRTDWFADKKHGIAIIMGEVSDNLVCRDFDDMAAYERWSTDYPELAAACPTVATGRPGRHVYFRANVAAITKRAGRTILLCGDDELRAGGYCLSPPSDFEGKPGQYSWIHPLHAKIPTIDPFEVDLAGGEGVNRENRENGGHDSLLSLSSLSSLLTGGDPVESAILRCLPSGVGCRHRCLFEFARELKAIPEWADKDAKALKPIVQRWHEAALPFIGTEPFEETWIDFFQAWPKVKYAAGDGPLDEIVKRVINSEPPDEALQFDNPQVRLLATICRELQRHAGDKPFYLATRTAGRFLDVDHTLAWRWLRLLIQEELPQVITKGNKTKATRYRYLGAR